MARVGHQQGIRGHYFATQYGVHHGVLQLLKALAGQRRGRDLQPGQSIQLGLARQVAFVGYRQHCLLGEQVYHLPVRLSQRLAGIYYQQHEVGLLDGLPAPLHRQRLHHVIAFHDTSRVNKDEGHAPEVNRLLQCVASSAGDGGDDGAALAQQAVEQA